MQNFSERLSQARKARQMTQAELAQRMHVSRQMVSHWENGRVIPSEETARRLCGLLDISAEEKKPHAPARRLSRWLPVAAACAALSVAVVLCTPLIQKKTENHNVAQAAAAQTTQRNVTPISTSLEWYQGADENVPGKAYVKFIPTETEVKVCYRAKEGPQCGWDAQFVYQEQNGFSFTPEKWTAVIFNADGSVRWVRTDMADEISYERLLLPQKPNTMGTFIPVDSSIGYGIAVEGVDENGNRLVFHGYIPLSQEEEKVYVPADFQAEQTPGEGKAFLTATPLAEVVTPVYFERYNEEGWEMDAEFKNTSDVPFTVKGMLSVMFRGEKIVYRNVFLAEQMLYWKELRDLTLQPGETFTHGSQCPVQDLTGMGYLVYGTDANGNDLEFWTYMSLSQEKAQ